MDVIIGGTMPLMVPAKYAPAEPHGCGRHALHSIHFRINWKTKRCGSYAWRLHGIHRLIRFRMCFNTRKETSIGAQLILAGSQDTVTSFMDLYYLAPQL